MYRRKQAMLPRFYCNEPTVNTLFDTLFSKSVLPTFRTGDFSAGASVNIIDNENDVTLQIVAPGFKKDEVTINLSDDVLTVSAKTESNQADEQTNYIRREYSSTEFSRSFSIPDYLDQDQISASHENGIVTVVIRKRSQVEKQARQIAIS